MSEMAPLLQEPGPADARPVIRAMVEQAIRENHAGAQISYDIGPVLTVQPDGQPAAGYLLILSMRSPLLSPPRIAAPIIVADAYPLQAQVDAEVRKGLQALYDCRQKLLSAGPAQQYHPGIN